MFLSILYLFIHSYRNRRFLRKGATLNISIILGIITLILSGWLIYLGITVGTEIFK